MSALPCISVSLTHIHDRRTETREDFGQKAWWNDLRPVHAILYGLFAWNAINKRAGSWKFLLADAIFGLISFLIYHWSNGNIQKMYS